MCLHFACVVLCLFFNYIFIEHPLMLIFLYLYTGSAPQAMVPIPPQYQVNVGANRSRAIVDWDFELTTVHFKRLRTACCPLLESESVDFPPMEVYFQKYHEDIALTKHSTRTLRMDLENVLKKKKPEEVKQLMDTLLQEVGTLNAVHTQFLLYTFAFEQRHHFCLHHWLLYAFVSARESGGLR